MQNREIPNRVTVAMGAGQPEYETLLLAVSINPEYQCKEFTGAFFPTPEEVQRICQGHPIMLTQLGGWRPMMLEVAQTADGNDG